MVFTNQELGAILKVVGVVANADNKVTKEESALMLVELLRFGVVGEKADVIIGEAEKFDFIGACLVISKMTYSEKKYVAAYFGAMICVDGKIDKVELNAWKLISHMCDLPVMHLEEAVEIMRNL